jgi:hypothetical protein
MSITKKKHIEKTNLILEQKYVKEKKLLNEKIEGIKSYEIRFKGKTDIEIKNYFKKYDPIFSKKPFLGKFPYENMGWRSSDDFVEHCIQKTKLESKPVEEVIEIEVNKLKQQDKDFIDTQIKREAAQMILRDPKEIEIMSEIISEKLSKDYENYKSKYPELSDSQISYILDYKFREFSAKYSQAVGIDSNGFYKKYEHLVDDVIYEQSKKKTNLIDYLSKYNIPVSEWGKGYAKTVEHLQKEIDSGECRLVLENGVLIREIEFVTCEIIYKEGDKIFKLIEEKQIFTDGRTRTRDKESSVSEKMKIGEDPKQSVFRGIEEELGVDLTETQLQKQGEINEDEVSNSFPGLMTRYKGYNYECEFTKEQYNPNGYTETQTDKTTYFIWKVIK